VQLLVCPEVGIVFVETADDLVEQSLFGRTARDHHLQRVQPFPEILERQGAVEE
jgi:hypothetical protein